MKTVFIDSDDTLIYGVIVKNLFMTKTYTMVPVKRCASLEVFTEMFEDSILQWHDPLPLSSLFPTFRKNILSLRLSKDEGTIFFRNVGNRLRSITSQKEEILYGMIFEFINAKLYPWTPSCARCMLLPYSHPVCPKAAARYQPHL